MTPAVGTGSTGLEVDELTVRFGGVTAVHRVWLQAPAGRITGLIGPNGAGKTTTFNACTGLVTAAEGTVRILGEDVSRLGPADRAQRGLGRTFQRIELFDSMSVLDNVATGPEARSVGSNALRQMVGRRGERARVLAAAGEALELCGLEAIAHRRAGSLSTGQRRLVELARAYAGGFPILLLDEPSSGLDEKETARFAGILNTIVSERDTAILIVEHDMALVMDICRYLYVLDFGELIFEGTPAETLGSDIVRAAYLGAEDGLQAAEIEAGVT